MPECSPSRSAFFTGRYPLRTGVTAAILDQDLPAAHVSPFEVTTPKVLSTAGYASALLGKYHLGGPENNPDGNRTPVALGWNHFNGNLRGGPPSIDTTLGGQYTQDRQKYSCGFPTGPQRGAAWFQGRDQDRCDDNGRAGYTGQQAVALGGIPALDARGNFAATCREAVDRVPDFNKPNGYYVWPPAILDAGGLETRRSREYMTTVQTDAAIDWIQAQSEGSHRLQPWMATVSYNSIHTPYQQPPIDLYPPGFVWPSNVTEDCLSTASQRILSDLMLAATDREIGRLLLGAGLARIEGGRFVYRPEATDTMIVIVGDNGTFLSSVRAPYDPSRAKGTPYETGVTAPLIVAGPLVVGPGRSVAHQVNAVDLFQLFGEIAGVDVRTVVPSSHVLDAESLLPYVRNPNQPSVRRYNFTELGIGLKPPSVKLWPCVIRVGPINLATDILFTSQTLCEDDVGGTWFGPTAERPVPQYPTSCAVRASGLYADLTIVPTRVWALRNDRYKLVKLERAPCDSGLGEFEFYDLSPRPPTNPVGLDLATTNLLTNGQPIGLTTEQMATYGELASQLQALLDSEPVCNGDGNLDKRVDQSDVAGVQRYLGQPSVFDFNKNGVTDSQDLQCASSNLGNDCRVSGAGRTCQ